MIYIKRRDYGQGASDQEQTVDVSANKELSLDRLIYRRIGSITDNKSLVEPVLPTTDFNRWLLDMNNLHLHKYYPLLAVNKPIPTPDVVALDEYLGTLGDTEVYPFSQDTYNQEVWLDIDSQTEHRILIDKSDNTYLTTNNGTEVLVVYTR